MSRKPTLEELNYIQKEVEEKGKKTNVAYTLSFTLGLLGVHLGYLGKTTSAMLRAVLSIVILIFIVLANANTIAFLQDYELTSRLQQNSSAIFIFLIIMITAQVLMLLRDISNIPAMIEETNGEIEKEASEKIKQAMYAEEAIMKGEAYNAVIEFVSKKVIESQTGNFERELEQTLLEFNKVKNEYIESGKILSSEKERVDQEIILVENAREKLKSKIEEFMKLIDEKDLAMAEASLNSPEGSGLVITKNGVDMILDKEIQEVDKFMDQLKGHSEDSVNLQEVKKEDDSEKEEKSLSSNLRKRGIQNKNKKLT